MKKILVFGTFDSLHPGHINFFEQAKKLGDYLVAVVARDVTVEKVKGRPPRRNENERLAAVIGSGKVDKALLGNLGDPYAIIKEVNPNIIALGYDQNSFSRDLPAALKKENLKIKILRLKPYKPEIYKSSIIKWKNKK